MCNNVHTGGLSSFCSKNEHESLYFQTSGPPGFVLFTAWFHRNIAIISVATHPSSFRSTHFTAL